MSRQGMLKLTFLLYLAFVVYGSLVPFAFRPHTFAQALEIFARTPWLDLGAGSRADWIANLVLYVPLAFLGRSALPTYGHTAITRHFLTTMVVLFCLLVAVAVEFTQIFFAPRTVSLNDLLAEALGTLLGVTLWTVGRHRLSRLGQAFLSGGRESVAAAIVAYLCLYLALAFFPFDFVLSWQELTAKVGGANQGWLLAGGTGNLLRGGTRLLSEIMAIAPLGMLAALLAQRVNLNRTFLAGLLIGAMLELLQLLLLSGVTQGASVLARGIGLAGGAWVGTRARDHGLRQLANGLRRLGPLLSPIYLLALIIAAGGFSHALLGTEEALAKFDTFQLLPFYFHYYTSEPVAMASLLANLGMYAPLGVYAWARHATTPRLRRRGPWEPALWAMLLAVLVESGKLWLAGGHPDFTNALIAAGGAVASYALATWVARVAGQTDAAANPEPTQAPTSPTDVAIKPRAKPPPPHAVLAVAAFGITLAGIWLYPLFTPLVAVLALAYGFLLWRFNWAWMFVLPAALPVLDLAPYTGRLLLDEFDLLILVTLGVGYWRLGTHRPAPWANTFFAKAVVLLVVSGMLATLLGLKPLLDGAPASLDYSHSSLDGLLVGKGLLWALLLIPLLRRISAEELTMARRWLINGLAAGLALLSLVVLWERHIFVGLGDFEGVFRVTGNFSTMNNGGAYIEAFIAIAFPALAVWTLQQKGMLLRLGGISMAALASYAMLVTFSRGGYAGLVVGLVVITLGFWGSSRKTGAARSLLLAALVLAVAAAATPVLLGGFAQGRLAQIERDLAVRLDHWKGAIGLIDAGLLPAITGMGFGRYPALYLWKSDVTRPPGTYAIINEQDRTALRLGGGDSYYLDQIVRIDPSQPYLLEARIRFHGSQNSVTVSLCEKALLYSFHCNWHQLRRPDDSTPDQWHVISVPLDTKGLGTTGRWPSPTIKLSVAAPSGGTGAIDIDRISLLDGRGEDQLSNGDFEHGLARWLSATDRDLAWHIHQSELEVYFAQGLLGIVAIGVALLATARTLWPRLRRGDPFAIAVGAGLASFLTVGLLGSTMDAARTSFLFYLLALAPGILLRNKVG